MYSSFFMGGGGTRERGGRRVDDRDSGHRHLTLNFFSVFCFLLLLLHVTFALLKSYMELIKIQVELDKIQELSGSLCTCHI